MEKGFMQGTKSGFSALLMCAVSVLLAPIAVAETPAISAKIVKIEGQKLVLDKGSLAGVAPKMIFDIYSKALVVQLPLSGDKEPIYIKQEVVARAIILSVSPNEARASIYGSPEEDAEVGYFALYNPTQKAENQAPYVAAVKPAKMSEFSWKERVNIQLTIVNEPEDEMYFEWSCRRLVNEDGEEGAFEGGVLLNQRTRIPSNIWITPPQKGSYRIQINVYDTAGKMATQTLDLVSLGIKPSGKSATNFKHKGVFCDSAIFQSVRDVTFDKNGSMYVLQGGSGSFVGGTAPSIKVIETNGNIKENAELPSDHKDCSRIVLSSRYLFLLDPENKVVKRFSLSSNGNIAQTLRNKPLQFGKGGVGNGKFSVPVDMCLDSRSNIAVLDAQQSAIQVFRESGVFQFSLGMEGTKLGQIQRGVALASDPNGRLFCLDDGRKKVLVFKDGRFDLELDCRSNGRLTGLSYDAYKDVLGIADLGKGVVQRLSLRTGKRTALVVPWRGTEPSMVGLMKLRESTMLRCDGRSRFVVVDRGGGSLALYDAVTTPNNPGFIGRLGGAAFGDSLKVSASPGGDLVTLDTSTRLVTRVDRRGWINLRLGGDESKAFSFKTPIDVGVGDSGKIYVLDAKLSQVFHFSALGVPLRPRLGTPGEGPSQLNSCLDMDCSGVRKNLCILQERKDHNMHQMLFNGRGQAWPRIATISDPEVGCQGNDGKFWIIDDDVLVSIPPGGAASPTSYEFDKVTDMSTGIDGHFYVVDVGDGFISVHRANGPQAGKITIKKISKPKDIGLDNYGRIYVYDDSTEKIHLLSE
jgi:hypothetical protein